MSFSTLGLAEPILRAIVDAGYTTPTPIQSQAIPAVLKGGDLLAGAQTGTGKTAGFTLPILHRLHTTKRANPASRAPRVLILTPTRELAAQVGESVRTYGVHLPQIKTAIVFGGVGIGPQIAALRQGVQVLVATPGRLLDLHQQRACDLSQIEIFVLDEADRMLDMGFVHDIKKVLAMLPASVGGVRRQNLLFSATFPEDIKMLADRLLDNPLRVEVERQKTTADNITQRIHPVDRERKRELLTHLIKEKQWFQVLVFTRTKHGASRLAEQLVRDDITAMAIHGNKSQGARTRALAEFKSNRLQVLVATDIAARGIDIDQLEHVVNYDLPNVPEDYVHRIGRTGRAGATGEAISLVTIDERQFLADIERLVKFEIPRVVIEGFEPDLNARPEPIQLGRRSMNGALPADRARGNGANSGRSRSKPAARPPAEPRGQGSGADDRRATHTRAPIEARPPRGAGKPHAQQQRGDGRRGAAGEPNGNVASPHGRSSSKGAHGQSHGHPPLPSARAAHPGTGTRSFGTASKRTAPSEPGMLLTGRGRGRS